MSESIVTLSEARNLDAVGEPGDVPVARSGVVRDRGRALVRRPRAPGRRALVAAGDHPAARHRRPVGQWQVVGAAGGHARGAGARRAAGQLDVAPGRDAAREAPDARARARLAGRPGRRPRRPAGPPDPHRGQRRPSPPHPPRGRPDGGGVDGVRGPGRARGVRRHAASSCWATRARRPRSCWLCGPTTSRRRRSTRSWPR